MDLNILGADVTVYEVDPEMMEGAKGEAKFRVITMLDLRYSIGVIGVACIMG